jgi:dTDP-L-rhamnose 4-epimerase
LSNPYTGVLAIFASRLLNDKPPLIYENGLQMRDFVSVEDVATACRLAMESADAPGHAINIGGGQSYSIRQVARLLADALDKPDVEPLITGKYRVGDIRHCFADISTAKRLLGYQPNITLEVGLALLVEWLRSQVAQDRVEEATAELTARGLTV